MDFKTRIKYINKMNGESSAELIKVTTENDKTSRDSQQEESKNLLAKKETNQPFTKRLIILAFTIGFIIKSFSFLLLLVINKHSQQTGLKGQTVKRSDETDYKASNFILENLNQSVDPCFNFWQFSCGNWLSRKEEEQDQFTMAIEQSLTDLSEILNEPISRDDNKAVANFKLFFKSCTNQTDIESNSDVQFIRLMTEKFGFWPIVKNLYEPKPFSSLFGIEEYLAKLVSIRMPLVFRFESIEHTTKMIMKITGTEDFCIMQKYLPKDDSTKAGFIKLLKQIKNYFNDALRINSIDDEEEFNEQINDMLQLLNKLYFLNDSRYLCGAPRARPSILYFNVYELDQNFTSNNQKQFDFEKFVDKLNDVSKTKLNKNSKILITSTALNYIKDVITGLNSLNLNRQRFHKAFINFVYFHSLFILLKPVELFSIPHYHIIFPIRYYQTFFEYDKVIVKGFLPIENFKSIYRLTLEQNCANSVIDLFSFAYSIEQIELQHFFVKQKFNHRIKSETRIMLKNIAISAIELINDQKWIDSSTKERIETKIKSLETYIGYSDSIDDGSDLTKNKTINYNLSNHYISNIFKMREKQFEIEFDSVENNDSMRKKSDFDMFLSTPLFLKEFNTLVFPAIVLMEPIFSLNNPVYLNYATVGVYLAHELWHSIEDEMLSNSKLFEGLDCLNHNYKIYLNETFEFSGYSESTLEEQIADNFGILVSLKAYLKLVNSNDHNYNNNLLPGLSYSKEELFFIRYSVSYCRKHNPNKNRIENFHVAHDYRSFQTSLIPEFVKHFHCSSENKYLLKQCDIFEFNL